MLHWGDMGGQWGVNRSVSQIHALLYPVGAAADRRGHRRHARRSRAPTSRTRSRSCSAWNLIRRVPIRGDRRDHFEAETDIWEVFLRIAAGRKEREIDPAIAALRACVADAERDDRVQPGRARAAQGHARLHRD